MQAKQARSTLTVSRISPPSLTRRQHWPGTVATQMAPSASAQIPSGAWGSPAQILRAAQDAAAMLAGAAARPTVLQIEERDGARWLVGPDPGGGV